MEPIITISGIRTTAIINSDFGLTSFMLSDDDIKYFNDKKMITHCKTNYSVEYKNFTLYGTGMLRGCFLNIESMFVVEK